MPQSPVSIIFGYDVPTPSSTYNGRMMQPVLVSPIPENAPDFEGVTVLRGQPVLQDGAGASVAPFADGIQGTVHVARGPGIEPVREHLARIERWMATLGQAHPPAPAP